MSKTQSCNGVKSMKIYLLRLITVMSYQITVIIKALVGFARIVDKNFIKHDDFLDKKIH
jgi:hypothetical protein